MATFMDRLAFLQKVPTLMKATADDEKPCPGFLFQEIGKMSQESPGCAQCLLEYLLERLQVDSCPVKLKVLKILVHLCAHGPQHLLTELRRNSTFIQQAAVYSGPPDPIHGTALYQKVRTTAQELASLLFTDASFTQNGLSPCTPATPTMGMGCESAHRSGMQGFGYNPVKRSTGGDTLLDRIQKAAEVVANAVLPPAEHQGIRLHDNHYRAVAAPCGRIEVAVPACAYSLPPHTPKVSQRCPGQVGGGWEEIDSGHSSSHNSSQENAANSGASGDESSKSGGTGSQSGASREGGDPAERVEAIQLGDCGQEMALIARLTEGSRVFLSRDESQHFLKECSTLNCEVVVELLSRRLQDPSDTVQMRALCAVACLMTSDLLSLERVLGATQRRLAQLSGGPGGPVANKATKILRQFEALMGGANCAARRVAAAAAANSAPPSTPAYPAPLLPTHPAGFTASGPPSEFPRAPLLPRDRGGSLKHDDDDEEEEEEEEERTPTPRDEDDVDGERTSEPRLKEQELRAEGGSPPGPPGPTGAAPSGPPPLPVHRHGAGVPGDRRRRRRDRLLPPPVDDGSSDAPPLRSPVAPNLSQSLSAFSFLNL